MIECIATNLKRYTFESPKIKKWVEDNCTGVVLNLFAGEVLLNVKEIRNDVNPDRPAHYHYDAVDFVEFWYKKHPTKKFRTVILDPPYSYRKAMEMYQGKYSSRFKMLADLLPSIITEDAHVISIGYHSTFLGKKRGYGLHKMCVFAHGGSQHCTIAIIEKIQKEK